MTDILQELPLSAGQITLWGVPADHQTGTSIPRRPLLTLPTRCGAPLRTDVSVRTWEQPNATLTASVTGEPLTGCASPGSSPTATVVSDTPPTAGASDADRPGLELAGRVSPLGGTARKPGLRVSLRHSGAANLRSVAISLPRVLALDARALANVCSREQARDGRCPASARVGSASLSTPLRAGGTSSPVYLVASRRGGRPALWTSLSDDGRRVVLEGVTAVRRDGRVTSTFADLPDVPLNALELRLRGGARGLLAVDRSRCRLPLAQRTAARVAVRSQGGASASQALSTGPWRGCARRR
jgi:hypothetical protein